MAKTVKTIKTMTIKRSMWTGADRCKDKTCPSQLVVVPHPICDNAKYAGHMCCLGFLGDRIGVSKDVMKNQGRLGKLLPTNHPYFKELTNEFLPKLPLTNALESILITINDATALSLQRKEEKIKALFQKYLNIKVRFID